MGRFFLGLIRLLLCPRSRETEDPSQTAPESRFPSQTTEDTDDAALVHPERPDPEENDVKPLTDRSSDDMTMKTSLLGRIEIMSHEAIILNRYLDSRNIWTYGIGFTKAAGTGIDPRYWKGEITVDRAVEIFEQVLPKYEKYVHNLLDGVKVAQHEFDALVSLAWNAGNIDKPMTGRLARSGDIAGAINLWRHNRELWKRRDKEVALALTGKYKAKTLLVGYADTNGELLRSTYRYIRVSTVIDKLNATGGLA